MNQLTPKTKKILLISGFIAIILIICIPLLYSFLHSATVIIQVAPLDATVTINGKEYASGLHQITPKSQSEVIVSAPNFETKTFNLDFKKGEITKILTYLVPEDDNWDYYKQLSNEDSLSVLLSLNGYQPWDLYQIDPNLTTDQDTTADDFLKTVFIRNATPYSFAICNGPATRTNCDAINISYDYYFECGNRLCLAITGRGPSLTTNTIDAIKEKLSARGYNFDDYEYFYEQKLETLPNDDDEGEA